MLPARSAVSVFIRLYLFFIRGKLFPTDYWERSDGRGSSRIKRRMNTDASGTLRRIRVYPPLSVLYPRKAVPCQALEKERRPRIIADQKNG